jgi:hypothetical protein
MAAAVVPPGNYLRGRLQVEQQGSSAAVSEGFDALFVIASGTITVIAGEAPMRRGEGREVVCFPIGSVPFQTKATSSAR